MAQLPAGLRVHAAGMNNSGVLPPLMIVDDNEDDVLLVARRLKEAGVTNSLLHFRDGAEAFDFLKQFCPPGRTSVQLPCLMFLDINMPGLSGFDILLWARKQPALAGIKIVVLSGANEEWDAKISAKLGADHYALKIPRAADLKKLIPPECLEPLTAPDPVPRGHSASRRFGE